MANGNANALDYPSPSPSLPYFAAASLDESNSRPFVVAWHPRPGDDMIPLRNNGIPTKEETARKKKTPSQTKLINQTTRQPDN
jgi:hypothetical protein